MNRLVCLLACVAVLAASRPAWAQPPLGEVAATFQINPSKVLADPVRKRVYAAVPATNSVAVISTTTLQMIANVPIGSDPVDMAISRDNKTLYVANSGSTLAAIGVLDLTTLTVKPSFSLPGSPSAVAAGLNGRVYASITGNNFQYDIEQLDGATGTITGGFSEDFYDENFLQISPDGKTLFVASVGVEPGSLQSFDVSKATPPTAALQINSDASDNDSQLVISHNGKYVCLPSGGGNPGAGTYETFLFSAADITNHYGEFDNGAYPGPLAFSPDDSLVYQTRYGSDPVLDVFDTRTFVATKEITLPSIGEEGYPDDINSIVTDNTGSYLFVAESSFNGGSTIGQLAVITTGAGTLTPPSLLPAITSSLSVDGTQDAPFTYQITATNTPTSYSATGLPTGLTVNAATGLISGTPTVENFFTVTITAANASGTATATLDLDIEYSDTSFIPVITNANLSNATLGKSYSAKVTASNSPFSYTASGLPAGLSIDAGSGAISGVPTTVGTYLVTVTATNGYGTGSAEFDLLVKNPAPVITSAASATGMVGIPFTYQITATGPASTFSAESLPDGLTCDADGLISGTPTTTGSYAVFLVALPDDTVNSPDGGMATLTLTLVPAPAPVITSAATASATVGQAFSYSIAASNHATSFGVVGLPEGLGVDPATGVISGTPTTVGVFTLSLTATNTAGPGTATLTLTVAAALPVLDIMATVPHVTAGSGDEGAITISRTGGDPTQKLVVHYLIKGSARNGTDYEMISGKAKIKPNKASATIQIIPLGSPAANTHTTVKLVLVPAANFQPGDSLKAKVKIFPSGE